MPPLALATFVPLHCALGDLRIEVEHGEPPPPSADVKRRWSDASAANPRLFNGPILRFRSFDPTARTILASRDTYQRYSMQRFDARTSTFERDVYHLAVTGVLLARDEAGREHVLLGRRGRETMLYPGHWELAPGGGLDSTDVYAQLLAEMEEELGLRVSTEPRLFEPPGPGDVLGLAIDPNAPSADIVLRLRARADVRTLRSAIADAPGEHSWEYGSTRWVAFDEVAAFAAAESGRTIPPTLAILRGIGWIR